MFRRWLVNSGRKTMKNSKLILTRKKNILGTFTKNNEFYFFSKLNRKKSTNPTMRRSIQRVSYAFKKMGLELVLGQHIDISWLHKSGGVEPQMSATSRIQQERISISNCYRNFLKQGPKALFWNLLPAGGPTKQAHPFQSGCSRQRHHRELKPETHHDR